MDMIDPSIVTDELVGEVLQVVLAHGHTHGVVFQCIIAFSSVAGLPEGAGDRLFDFWWDTTARPSADRVYEVVSPSHEESEKKSIIRHFLQKMIYDYNVRNLQ